MYRRLSGFEENCQVRLDLHANDNRPIQNIVKLDDNTLCTPAIIKFT